MKALCAVLNLLNTISKEKNVRCYMLLLFCLTKREVMLLLRVNKAFFMKECSEESNLLQ